MKKGWEIKTLGEVCDKASSNIAKNTLSKNEGIYPIYGASGFIKNIDFYQQEKIYIAIVKDGSGVGRVTMYPSKSSILGTMQYIIPKENINTKYVYYFLNSIDFNKYKCGAAIPHIYFKDYSSEKFLIPPIEEQEEIIKKMDKGFALIEELKDKVKKNLDNAKEFFQSALREELSPKEGWETKRLGEVTKIIGGGTPQKNREKYYSGDILWATVRDMKNEVLSDTEFKITSEGLKNSSTNIIPKNNIIIATRVGLGKVCKLYYDTAINQDLKGILPILKYTNSEYLYYYFISQSDYIIKNGKGATVHGVTLGFINSMMIYFPSSIKEQKEIVGRLDLIKGKCEVLEGNYNRVLELCEELKQGLLREAFLSEKL